MKQILLTIILLSGIKCMSQTGVISGNAFWKYNDYVGDKPDAGSPVFLFPSDTSLEPLETLCDVQGYFKFENIPLGQYLIIIRSKNSNSSYYDHLQLLGKSPTKKYLGFDIKEIDTVMLDSIDYNKKKVEDYKNKMKSTMKAFKTYVKMEDDLQRAVDKLLDKIPPNPKYRKVMFDAPILGQLYITEIQVKQNQTTTVIADFGTTYSKIN